MPDVPTPFDRPFQGAAAYYARYRPPYPGALVALLRDTFHLDGSGRLLDLGCGPGSVSISLAHLFERVVAMDPEPDMLEEGAAQATAAGVANIDWVRASSRDLLPSLGTFRLVTMGESFHWMDRSATLAALYDLVEFDGGVAIVGRGTPLPLPPMTPWRSAVVPVLREYLGNVVLPWDHGPIPAEDLHQAVLRQSRFTDLREHSELFEVEWTLEAMIGNLYSMSFCNRDRLGERAAPFERDLRSAVLAVEPSGVLRGEVHEFFAKLAFKRDGSAR
jgi:ubiquinone/menaquinone biosynthesis C-methylase UbiE